MKQKISKKQKNISRPSTVPHPSPLPHPSIVSHPSSELSLPSCVIQTKRPFWKPPGYNY